MGSTDEQDVASNAIEQSSVSGPIEIRGSQPDTSPGNSGEPRVDGEEQGVTMGEELAQESESSTTDAVLEIEVDEETASVPSKADPGQANVPAPAGIPRSPAASEVVQKVMSSDGTGPDNEKTGTKRPASIADLHEEGPEQDVANHADADVTEMSAGLREGGHPCGSPAAPALHQGATPPAGKAPRRNRWLPATSVSVPHTRSEDHSDPSYSPTSPAEPAHPASADAPAGPAGSRPLLVGPVAVKSKAVKPAKAQKLQTAEQGLVDAIQSRLHPLPESNQSLLSVAAEGPTSTVAANPEMPPVPAEAHGVQKSADVRATTTEIDLRDTENGPVDADLTHMAEQRAMQMVHRFQTAAIEMNDQAKDTALEVAPRSSTTSIAAPPTSLYANLPQEWPLARLSLQLKHIGVMLRVTLYRRLAELSFRGVDFRQLPREVMMYFCQDFDTIGRDVAGRLASLFNFLELRSQEPVKGDPMGLSLYANPTYWLYGLLSFCAKACEQKSAEVGGHPALESRTVKREQNTPVLESNGRTLSLMQTVVMSFGRNQDLGKADLPLHHLHVYFPVQLVHKLIARIIELKYTDETPEDCKKYRPNSQSEANSPYIVVGTYDGVCTSDSYASFPNTPRLAGMYEHGLLDVNLGQLTSFQSSYKSTLRIEVPVWPDVLQAVLPNQQGKRQPSSAKSPAASVLGTGVKEEEEEDETYVPPEGQGCFSFRQDLLLRARDTYAVRTIGNKYEILSQWLLTGLAVALSKPHWRFLANEGIVSTTPQSLLRTYYQQGYSASLPPRELPYGTQRANTVSGTAWQHKVTWYSSASYLRDLAALRATKARTPISTFYHQMNHLNPIQAVPLEEEQPEQEESAQPMTQAKAAT